MKSEKGLNILPEMLFFPYLKNPLNVAEIVSVPGEDIIQQGIELGSECMEGARRRSRTIDWLLASGEYVTVDDTPRFISVVGYEKDPREGPYCVHMIVVKS
ncbi:hypothetical protein NQ317_013307 [Molorchus minor]|uniref:Uncharacterized protein n=1 Tax=Molorchus minor TaxID=1323400 RepID=A0ABQ9JAP5_9CUCU|nr:hypothetical protein NQ317_013307 [Molorchus minor]